jgi:serine/threonine protein phosphatase PrpC
MEGLKILKISEPASKEFLEIALAQSNSELVKLTDYVHFQEDAMRQSEKYPIFVVADGVTLEFGNDGSYPIPSGASAVAHIFCEKVIEEADKRYTNFSKEDIEIVFTKANEAVGEYNLKNGRTKDKINFWDFDLFAATGAFVLIKGDKIYWATICDSFAAQFEKKGKIKFQSPPCWTAMRSKMQKNPANLSEVEKRKLVRRVYRNGIDNKGNLIGYGVITGEESAMKYLNSGRLKLKTGDLVALFTDGFEEYLKLPEFIELFKEWPDDLEEILQKFTAEKSKEEPEKFGHERTLIVIRYN